MTLINTTRFGRLEIAESDIYAFPLGIPGFPDQKRFFLLPNPGGGPFKWLQSAAKPELAFVVCDPLLFAPDYVAEVRKEDLEAIELSAIEQGFVLAILTIPSDPKKMTANLLGPLVFNPGAMKARQIVLARSTSFARVPVFGAKA